MSVTFTPSAASDSGNPVGRAAHVGDRPLRGEPQIRHDDLRGSIGEELARADVRIRDPLGPGRVFPAAASFAIA